MVQIISCSVRGSRLLLENQKTDCTLIPNPIDLRGWVSCTQFQQNSLTSGHVFGRRQCYPQLPYLISYDVNVHFLSWSQMHSTLLFCSISSPITNSQLSPMYHNKQMVRCSESVSWYSIGREKEGVCLVKKVRIVRACISHIVSSQFSSCQPLKLTCFLELSKSFLSHLLLNDETKRRRQIVFSILAIVKSNSMQFQTTLKLFLASIIVFTILTCVSVDQQYSMMRSMTNTTCPQQFIMYC